MKDQESRGRYSISRKSYDFSVCPTCGGTGWEPYKASCRELYGDDRLLDFARPCPTCSGGLPQRSENAKKLSNIPAVFYDKGYGSFDWTIYKDGSGNAVDMSNQREFIEDFLKNFMAWKAKGYGLYIYSKTKGSGKTFLASCLCNELMTLYGTRTRFVSATQLLDISKSGEPGSSDEYRREPIKLLCDCELLVIDDIGQKKTGYDWMNEVCFRIIDDRYTKGLVTIFTSNLHINELNLEERITERINKVSMSMNLPEYNVRARETYADKIRFLEKEGLLKKGGKQ